MEMNGSVSGDMYRAGVCMGCAYSCDAIGGVVDSDVAAETASGRHSFERQVWCCGFVVLWLERMSIMHVHWKV